MRVYHPGKVIEIFKKTDKDVICADESAQAVLDMWDENVLTMLASPKISARIKPGQLVLVDYRADEKHNPPVPRHEIVKIITGKRAQKIWAAYKDMLEKRKRKAKPEAIVPAEQSYIG